MGVAVGFDPLYALSYTLPSCSSLSASYSSRQCSGTRRISSAFTAVEKAPFHLFEASSSHFSISGSPASSQVRVQRKLSWSRGRAGKLASGKKCGGLGRNSLFDSEVNCADCARQGARVLGQLDRIVTSEARCEVFTGSYREKTFGVHRSCFSRFNDSSKHLTGRRASIIARCEAEGGGISFDERIATADSGAAGGERYGQSSAESSDGAVSANGKSGEEVLPSLVPPPVTEILQRVREETGEESAVEVMKEILRVAKEDIEKCRRNSEQFEEKAQSIAEKAIRLKDEVAEKEKSLNAAVLTMDRLIVDEAAAEEELEKSISSLKIAEELVRTAEAELEDAFSRGKADVEDESGEPKLAEATEEVRTEQTAKVLVKPADGDPSTGKDTTESKTEVSVEGANADVVGATAAAMMEERRGLESAKALLKNSDANFERYQAELARIRAEKVECERQVERLRSEAEKSRAIALAADDDAATAMAEAEQAVALELEAAQRVGDAEFAIHKAESYVTDAARQAATFVAVEAEKLALSLGKSAESIEEGLEERTGAVDAEVSSEAGISEGKTTLEESAPTLPDIGLAKEQEEEIKAAVAAAEVAALPDKPTKESEQDGKKAEPVKEPQVPKASKKRSSRFFSASYFSSDDGEEFSPGKAYAQIAQALKPKLAKIVVGVALIFAGTAFMNNRLEKRGVLPQLPVYSTTIDRAKPIVAEFKKLTTRARDLVNKLPAQEVSEEEASLFDVLWLLLASVVFVPLFMKIPGGSPVLGYLVAGVLIGPHTVHIIKNVHGTKAIAEFGVVFLLFNIGLELSVERLSSMKKYVFGLGSAQVIATATGIGLVLSHVVNITGPPAIIIASGLALSSTAVVLQVLQERGESTSRHGRATFSVLLFQDLAVVVLLILIPLLSAKGGVGLQAIASALGIAGIKAVVAIVGIIASGRLFLRPIYKQIADNHNAEIFAANTLLVVLGTSVLTARAGLSMALGAFLAGLLLAETEFALQVESDIAPYRGLLLGLFFMTVGMSIDPKLLVAKFPEIAGALAVLIVGKTALVAAVGRFFGLSPIAAIRAGLLLAPGGEFAFVAFGEAVNQGILSSQLSSLLFLVVGLSMALTPWLAAGGQVIAARFEQQDVRSLLPQENETDDLRGHIIIAGFGRVGQIIAQLLSERLIPFVALDVRSDRVSVGRALDLPVYFGDAGNKEVLHKVGAERAAAAVITLDTPGANYRTVWALSKHFPKVKTFVRAHDVDHGMTLEKAGATAVVPETLEPSLQLAAAVLAQAKVPAYEIASAIDEFRGRHLSELAELTQRSGTSLGYGFSRMITKPLIEAAKIRTDDEGVIEKLIEGNIVAVP